MFSSDFPDVDIPDSTVYDYLFSDLGDEDAERVAIIDAATGIETSFRALRYQVDALAGALAARGVGAGGDATRPTVVAILCPNSTAFAVVFHGVLRTGGVITPVNALSTADEIAHQLRDADAQWLITVGALLPQAVAAASSAGMPQARVIVADGADGHVSLRELLAEDASPPDLEIDPATHLAVLPYSSGTTGRPKGVMLTHRNLVANVQQSRVGIDVRRSDRVLAVLPFFHIYGMNVLLNLGLRQRATLVTMPRFALEPYLAHVQQYRCTYLFVAPPLALSLAKHDAVDRFDLSSVRTIVSGAAPLDGDTAERAGRRVGAQIVQGFGMTELSPVSHVSPPDRSDIPVSAVGVLVPNQSCKLVDVDSGAEITEVGADGASAPGELWVRGPNVMLGYLNRPEDTAVAIDEDGFLHTGDVAVYHRGGYFSVVDRVKELIKYKGYQIAPAELEALLLTHPRIRDVAVIGVLDDDGQEIPQAFVVLADETALTAEEIMAFVADRVAPHKKVRRVQFVEGIPKSASGKILRKDLRRAVAVAPAGRG
jgi:acyl-CoA synthetase (AMP-forming)/AMP-acid ligase II